MQNEEGQQKFGPKEYAIIGGTIIAVLIAVFVIFNFIVADNPHAVNKAPENVVGTSEKAMEMKREQAMKAGGAPGAGAPAGGRGGGGVGDDIDPRNFKK